jgi:hypothetical protein
LNQVSSSGFGGTTLSRKQWAYLIAEEAHSLGYKLTARQLAEGLGVREAEGDTSEGAHIGPWEEEVGFGTRKQRLDYRTSTRLALQRWKSDGQTWWPAWGKWETGESEGAGPTRYKRHLALARQALRHVGSVPPMGPGPRASSPAAQAAAAETPVATVSGGGLSSDLMHFGLVGVLVLGGTGFIGFGATRMLGSRKATA